MKESLDRIGVLVLNSENKVGSSSIKSIPAMFLGQAQLQWILVRKTPLR